MSAFLRTDQDLARVPVPPPAPAKPQRAPFLRELAQRLEDARLDRGSVDVVVSEEEAALAAVESELAQARASFDMATKARRDAETAYLANPSSASTASGVEDADRRLRLATLALDRVRERHQVASEAFKSSCEVRDARALEIRKLELTIAAHPATVARLRDPLVRAAFEHVELALEALRAAAKVNEDALATIATYQREGLGFLPAPSGRSGAALPIVEDLAAREVFLWDGPQTELADATGPHNLSHRVPEIIGMLASIAAGRGGVGASKSKDAFLRECAVERGDELGAQAAIDLQREKDESQRRAQAAPVAPAPRSLTATTGHVVHAPRPGQPGRVEQARDLVPAPSPPTLPELAARAVGSLVRRAVGDAGKAPR